MRLFLIVACVTVLFGCKPEEARETPPFVSQLVAHIEAGSVRNPLASIWQYRYGDRVVYYVPPYCCDVPGELFDSNGEFICAPDGGITGNGDGQCPDFFSTRTHELRIWADDR